MISVKRVSWCDVCDELRCTFEGDETDIKRDVMNQVASCWRIGSTALIVRREQSELVIMCLAGSDLKTTAPVILQAAKQAGCQTIRFHTKRKGLGRLLEPFGFALHEYIFRAGL